MAAGSMLARAVLVFGLALAVASLSAQAATAQTRPAVVELFTSQGCSSCPPADALLRELARRGDVIALGYHIDYWDKLGWRDPLSTPAATSRQRDYARRFSGQVYTPQMVIDGTAELVGSDRDAVAASLRTPRRDAVVPISIAPDRRSVTVGPGPGAGGVIVVRFLRHRTTQVGGGENSGRVAEDANGVTSLTMLGGWDGSAKRLPLEPPGAGEGIAVLLQASSGAMLGAAQALAE